MQPRKKVLHPKLPQLAGYKVKDLLTKAVQPNQVAQAPKQPKTPEAPKHPIGQVFQTRTPNFCMVTRPDPADPNSTQTVRASCDPNKAQEGAGEGGAKQPESQVTPPEVGQSPVDRTQEGAEASAQQGAVVEPITFDNWFEGLTDDTSEGQDSIPYDNEWADAPYDDWAEVYLDREGRPTPKPEEPQPGTEGEMAEMEIFDLPVDVWKDPEKRDLLPINLTSEKQKEVAGHFWDQILESNLTDDNKTLYTNYVDSIITNMPDKALEELQKGVSGSSVFVNTLQEVADRWLDVYKANGEYAKREKEFDKVYGEIKGSAALYAPDLKAIIIDGGEEATQSRDYTSYTSRGNFAHELTHGIDGPDYQYSKQRPWEKAFYNELLDGQLCHYATKSEQEGFAEFGRLLYAGEHYHKDIKKNFPLCFAFWEKAGLVKPQEFNQAEQRTEREAKEHTEFEDTNREQAPNS